MDRKDKILYHGVRGVVRLLGLIPYTMHEALGRIFGRAWYKLDKKHRNLTINNIRYAYGDSVTGEEAENLAAKVFENFSRMVFEHAWFSRLDPQEYHRYFRVKGLHHLYRAHAKGRGVICISAHMGNWELGLAMYQLFKVPFCVVYKPIKNQGINAYLLEKRTIEGFEMVGKEGASKNVRKMLEKGYAAGLLIDQNTRRNYGVFIDFFGKKACANKNVAKLALRTSAPVVPLFIYREKGWFVFEILPEVELTKSGDPESDIFENTRKFADIVEDFVRKYPEQWFWVHNRWRTRPMEEKLKKNSGEE